MIFRDKFKSYSLTLPEEMEASLREELLRLTEEEQTALLLALESTDFEATICSHEYDREVVPIDQWLLDDYHMGGVAKTLYGVWRNDLIEIFQSQQYSQAVITGSTGCLAAGHLVQAANGEIKTIESMRGREDVVSLFDAHFFAVGKATGVKATVTVRFGHGFEVRCTPDHKFMTQRGWVEAKDLDPKRDRVRTPRTIRVLPDVFTVSEVEAEWVGMMTADGSLRKAHGNSFHKADHAVVARFCRLSDALGITWREEATRSKARAICCHSMSYEVVDRHGLRGLRAWEKTVSPKIMRSPLSVVAAYLRGLFLDAQWALDSKTKAGKRAVYGVTLSLANERLIKQTWLLLKRFGIRGRVSSSHSGRPNERPMWHVEVRGISNLIAFDKAIGCPIDGHAERWAALVAAIKTKKENSNADLLPVTWAEAGAWVKRHGIKRPRGSRYACWQNSVAGKARLVSALKMSEFVADHPEMAAHVADVHFEPGVFWESVDAVDNDGIEVETYDLVVPNGNAYLVDGVHTHNTGKSHFSHFVVLRMIYEASCLRDPARSYGLSTGSAIGFCTIASSKETARRVVFEGIQSKMKESPYFQYEFATKRETKDEIVFPKGIQIVAGSSTDTSIIGMNIFGGVMDEGNFVRTSHATGHNGHGSAQQRGRNLEKANRLYTSIIRRMKSRFNKHGKLPGMLCVLSSKTTHDSFTEKVIAKATADKDTQIFVRDRSLVDVKRDQFSPEIFKVLVGNESYPSRILPPDDDVTQYGKAAMIIDVPEDLRRDFESNMEECLTGDTMIPLLDGTTVPIKELVGRGEFWVYSYGVDGRIHPGRGYDARVTIHDAEIYRVTLDNGAEIRCTAHHPFMRLDGTYTDAVELKPGDALMPFRRRFDRHGYEQIKANCGMRGWHATHRLVAVHHNRDGVPYANSVVHHINFNHRDNRPENLMICSPEEHYRIHTERLHLTIHSPEAKAKSTETRRRLWAEGGHEWQEVHRKRSSEAFTRYNKTQAHREAARRVGLTVGSANLAASRNKESHKEAVLRALKLRNAENNPAKSPEARKKNSESRKKAWASGKYDHANLAKNFTDRPGWGPHVQHHVRKGVLSDRCRWCLPEMDAKNHKVISVEPCGREDVYDISVDKWHNFATAAGVVVHNSLRDLLGVSTVAISSFVQRVDLVEQMKDPTREHPFMCALMGNITEWDSRMPYKMNWHKLAKRKDNGEWEPLLNPHAPRAVGLDPASTGDAFGLSIGHISHVVPATDGPINDDTITEWQPFFVIDFVLRIKGHPGEEVLFKNVRKLVYLFSQHGFHISNVTTDSYQSLEMIQSFQEQGYNAEVLSVDTSKDPYRFLRSVIYDRRVKCYDYPQLFAEIKNLEDTPMKIDHRPSGSKDISDAVTQVLWTLYREYNQKQPILPQKGRSDFSQSPRIATALENAKPLFQPQEEVEMEDVKEQHATIAASQEIAAAVAPKVYVKKNAPKVVGPGYKKRNVDGTTEDLAAAAAQAPSDVEDFLVRG